MNDNAAKRPTVFISYSQDEEWKDRLVTRLGVLAQEGLLDTWDDRRIGAGGENEIEDTLKKASAAVFQRIFPLQNSQQVIFFTSACISC